MAKYEVKMSCGHTETIQLFGKMADRDKKIAWLEEHGICTACYKARKDAAHAEETAAAKAKAAEEKLPVLTGSEKQVNWALSIRAKKFADLDKMLADMTTTDEQLRRKNQIAIQATKNVLASKTDSRFWIDNRNVEARKLIAANNLQDELKAEFARLTAEASATEVDADEYAVSTEAQEVAVDAEIELATATNTTDEINIDDATYRTILLHAEKISNGQNSFAAVLKNELRNLLNVDASELIEAIKTDSNYLNRVRCYLADYPIIITNDEGTRYHLVKLTDDYCELDIIMTNDAATTTEQEENTMMTMTDADRILAERKTMTRRELFLEAKKEITYKLNARGAKIWYISYPQYDIRGKYIGHTPALKCTRKEVVAYLRDNYCGLTVDDFLAEQETWIDEETTKAINQMAIDDQAEHVSDKVSREVKPCDDNDDGFALLPDTDELNDVSDIAPVIQPLRQTFVFTPVGNERHQILTSGDVVTFLNGKLHHVTSTKYAAWFSVCFCHYAWHIFKDGKIDGVNGTNDEEEFFAEMAKRGACTIDEPEPPTDDELQLLLDSVIGERTDEFNFTAQNGENFTCVLDGVFIKKPLRLDKFIFITWQWRILGVYFTPAQVDKVIDMLRAAIERGGKEFKFPTIDELTAAEKDLSQETWGRADSDIPQDYLDAIVAQTMPRKRREPTTDVELIANGDELKAIEGRIMGRELPRFGQPNFDAPLVEWYREYQFRRSNPFWYENEYHYLDDGTRIHAKK